MKAGDAVKRALGLLRVVDAQGAPDELDMETGLSRLNDMMNLWESEGLSLGWQNVELPEDVLVTPPNANIAIVYNLAGYLADDYGVDLAPRVGILAQDAKSTLIGNQAVTTDEVVSYEDYPRGQGQRVGYSWRDGYYR
jgi:hypothetical protein